MNSKGTSNYKFWPVPSSVSMTSTVSRPSLPPPPILMFPSQSLLPRILTMLLRIIYRLNPVMVLQSENQSGGASQWRVWLLVMQKYTIPASRESLDYSFGKSWWICLVVEFHLLAFHLQPEQGKRPSHLGIHKQTNASWSIPWSQTVFYHLKICRKWELWNLCYGPILPFYKWSNVLVGVETKLNLENWGAGGIGKVKHFIV